MGAFFKTPDVRLCTQQFQQIPERILTTHRGRKFLPWGCPGGEGRCCWGGGGAEVQPPRSPGPSRSGASNQGPPSSGCRSNLALILHAPGHWPAATDPHSGAWSLLPLRSGGFQRTVCAMETVARGGRSEGRRLEGVCDPRGARAGGRRVGGRRRRAWK